MSTISDQPHLNGYGAFIRRISKVQSIPTPFPSIPDPPPPYFGFARPYPCSALSAALLARHCYSMITVQQTWAGPQAHAAYAAYAAAGISMLPTWQHPHAWCPYNSARILGSAVFSARQASERRGPSLHFSLCSSQRDYWMAGQVGRALD